MQMQTPGSILKHSGMKMLSKPMFYELGADEDERTVNLPDIKTNQVRFKDEDTENNLNENYEVEAHESDEENKETNWISLINVFN